MQVQSKVVPSDRESEGSVADEDFNIKNPKIVGAVVKWDAMWRDKANGVKNPQGADSDLGLAHELLGHGLQAMVRQLDTKPQAYIVGVGRFPVIENDAQHISNRVATATNRGDMIKPVYIMWKTVDGANKRIAYPIDPNQVIQWNKNMKY